MTPSTSICNALQREEVWIALSKAAAAPDDFTSVVSALGLDKKYDFRFSNLSGVDFSNADLRGFDFRGADLRDSYGSPVIFDDSTNLDEADTERSCFAEHKRQRELYRWNQSAPKFYKALKECDPLEFSAWIHGRRKAGRGGHTLLKKMDSETASILCRKLMADDIDLTKRTDLFYHISEFCESNESKRELILEVLARHHDDESVLRKFVSVAGDMYSNDASVGATLFKVCQNSSEKLRIAAFSALSKSRFFFSHIDEMQSIFMSDENSNLRRTLIRSAALSLGTKHIEAINLMALRSEVPINAVVDFEDIIARKHCYTIAEVIAARETANLSRRLDGRSITPVANAGVTSEAAASVSRRQDEVLLKTGVARLFFVHDYRRRAADAMWRLDPKSITPWARDSENLRSRQTQPLY